MPSNDILMFIGKNGLSHEIHLLLFRSNLKKVFWVFLCNCIYYQAALAFLAVVLWQGMAIKGLKSPIPT
jgi:hypothetical protein